MLALIRIDQLARLTRDLLNILREVKGRDATFHSLAEPWADTDDEIAKVVLTILGAIAEVERGFYPGANGSRRGTSQSARCARGSEIQAERVSDCSSGRHEPTPGQRRARDCKAVERQYRHGFTAFAGCYNQGG